MANTATKKTVALFTTCLVDLWRPSVARAAQSVLEKAGYTVVVPAAQTCCGQPNWNAGDRRGAEKLARRTVEILKAHDYVVVPSGSCADMIRNHYPALFAGERDFIAEVRALAAKTYELTAFLATVAQWKPAPARGAKRKLAYHDSCSCKRALGLYKEPRALLAAAGGYEVVPVAGEDICCGFGGMFSLKYGEISSHMAGKKTAAIGHSGAEVVAGADLGCLLNLAGKLTAEGRSVAVRHIAEILDEEGGE